MMETRIGQTRSAITRISCTLLVIVSIFVLSSCVGATNVPDERQLRGERAIVAAKEKTARRRRTQVEREPNQRSMDTETSSGVFQKLNRIVNGNPVKNPVRYPWFTLVLGDCIEGDCESCGGSLIANDLVLTAAHCEDPEVAHPGRHDLGTTPSESIVVESFERHPNWNYTTRDANFDIMIVRLSQASETTKRVRLNYDNDYPNVADESLTMIGFGSKIGGTESVGLDPEIELPQFLQSAETLYVPFETCALAKDPDSEYEYGIGFSEDKTQVRPHWLCTLGPDSGTDLVTSNCYGDSGGPIFKEDFFEDSPEDVATNDILLAVIVGSSRYCGNKYLPNINQRVSYHKQWIVERGCAMSNDPPPEWNCPTLEGFRIEAPDNNNVYIPTPAPIPNEPNGLKAVDEDPPTAEPTTAKPTVSPTVSPTAATPTLVPTPVPTTEPTTAKPTVSPTTASPTLVPTPVPTTEKPNPFFVPILDPSATSTRKPTRYPTRSEDSSDDKEVGYVCPICKYKEHVITNPKAVVFVPVLGQKTCQELFEDASEGEISEGSICQSVLLMASSVCNCAYATTSPTSSPSKSPTTSPTTSPSSHPSVTPTNSPTLQPSVSPTVLPSVSPTHSPTKTQDTCDAIDIANQERDPAMMVNVKITFAFEDLNAANSVGWYISDPHYKCFRVGVANGRYSNREVIEELSLVGGVEYLFVLDVDGKRASGSYSLTSKNVTLGQNLIPGVIYDDEGTFFKTPRN